MAYRLILFNSGQKNGSQKFFFYYHIHQFQNELHQEKNVLSIMPYLTFLTPLRKIHTAIFVILTIVVFMIKWRILEQKQ